MDAVGWDPMMSDYQDSTFNSYHQGVGRDLSNGNWRGPKLFVDNFPTDLGQDGLYKMFSEAGRVIDAQLKPSNRANKLLTFGFVTMESAVAAERAINQWNQRILKSGIQLKVIPAMTDEEKKRRQAAKEIEARFYSTIKGNFGRDDDLMSSVSSYSRQPEQVYEPRAPPRRAPDTSGYGFDYGRGQWGGRSDGFNNPDYFNQGRGRAQAFRGSGFFNAQKQDLSSILFGGRGRGRGCGFGRPWQEPWMGRFNFGRGSLPPAAQIQLPTRRPSENLKVCVTCGLEGSTYRCRICKMYYCSKRCQREDWPNHREICLDVSIHNFKTKTQLDISHCLAGVNLVEDDQDDEQSVISSHSKQSSAKMYKSFERDEPKRQAANDKSLRKPDRGYESETPSSMRLQNGKKSFQNNKKYQPDKENKERYQDKNPNIHNEERGSDRDKERKPKRSIYKASTDDMDLPMVFQNSSTISARTSDKDVKQSKAAIGKQQEQGNKKSGPSKPINKRKIDENSEPPRRKPPGSGDFDARDKGDSEKSKVPANRERKSPKKPEKFVSKASSPPEIPDCSGDASCDLAYQTMDVGNEGECYLSHYESPSKLWILLKDDLCEFLRLSDDYKKYVLDTQPKGAVKKVKAGDLYCVIHEDYWTRLRVMTVNPDGTVTVFFPDVGSQETFDLSRLYHLDESMRIFPAQAVCCCVGGVKPQGKPGWNEMAKKAVKKWLGEPWGKSFSFKVMDRRGNSHALEIFNEGENLADILISQGLAEKSGSSANLPKMSNVVEKQQKSPVKDKRYMAKDMKHESDHLEEQDRISISITECETLTQFTAHLITPNTMKALGEIESIMKKMNLDNGTPYSPEKGELVLAKYSFDKQWYRSEVTHVEGDRFQVYFVDYGNSEQLSSKGIRLINDRLVTFPAQAAKLIISGVKVDMKSEAAIAKVQVLLDEFAVEAGKWSVVVKGKRESALLVDFVSWAKEETLSHYLNETKTSPKKTSPKKTSPKKTSLSPMSIEKAASNPNKSDDEESSMVTKLSATTLPNSGKCEVLVNFVKNCSSFYIMLTDNNQNMINLTVDIISRIESVPMLVDPVIGKLALAKYAEDNSWYRALVKNVKKQSCDVFFVDYGNTEEVSLENLRQMPQWATVEPALAIHCGLDVETVQLCSDAETVFKTIECQPVHVSFLRKEGDKCVVKMLHEDLDILQHLAVETKTKNSSPASKTSAPVKSEISSSIEVEMMPVSQEPVIALPTYIQSMCEFYVMANNRLQEFGELNSKLQMKAHEGTTPLQEFSVGTLCMAQFKEDLSWCRAQIISADSEEVCIVKFFDFGNSQKTPRKELKELPDFARSLPAASIPCCFKEYEDYLTNGRQEELEVIQSGKEFATLQAQFPYNEVSLTVHKHKANVCVVSVTDKDGNNIIKTFKVQPPVSPVAKPGKTAASDSDSPKQTEKQQQQRRPQAIAPTLDDIAVARIIDQDKFAVICTNMSGLSEFYCQRKEDYVLKALEISEMLAVDLQSCSPATSKPTVNGVYGCFYEGSWYRCVVEEVVGESVLIFYIDWGNREQRAINELRNLEAKHLAYPVSLMRCTLHGVEIVDNTDRREEIKYIAMLQEKMNFGVLCVRVVHSQGNSYSVGLSFCSDENSTEVDIVQDLIDVNIARPLTSAVDKASPSTNKAEERVTATASSVVDKVEEEEEEEEDEDDKQLRELQKMMEEIQKRKSKKN